MLINYKEIGLRYKSWANAGSISLCFRFVSVIH